MVSMTGDGRLEEGVEGAVDFESLGPLISGSGPPVIHSAHLCSSTRSRGGRRAQSVPDRAALLPATLSRGNRRP